VRGSVGMPETKQEEHVDLHEKNNKNITRPSTATTQMNVYEIDAYVPCMLVYTLFNFENILNFDAVPFLFLFDKYCLIID